MSADAVSLVSSFARIRERAQSVWLFAAFRLFSLTAGRASGVAQWLKRQLVRRLVGSGQDIPLQLERSVQFAHDHVRVIDRVVTGPAIELRQFRKMALGDALIAATALESGRELLTHNSKDYREVPALVVIDPIENGDPA